MNRQLFDVFGKKRVRSTKIIFRSGRGNLVERFQPQITGSVGGLVKNYLNGWQNNSNSFYLFFWPLVCQKLLLLCEHLWNYLVADHSAKWTQACSSEQFYSPAISKMTGGTPEVRSVKINLIDFWHLTFDLIDYIWHSNNGPMDQWTNSTQDSPKIVPR